MLIARTHVHDGAYDPARQEDARKRNALVLLAALGYRERRWEELVRSLSYQQRVRAMLGLRVVSQTLIPTSLDDI